MPERTLLSGCSWTGKLVPKPPRPCHPPISFSCSPLVLLLSLWLFHFSNLIDSDDLLFNRRQHVFSWDWRGSLAAACCGPLTNAVNQKSDSKLWQRLCVHSSHQHVSAPITRHPALNICCVMAIATELANMDIYQQPPPAINTHGLYLCVDGCSAGRGTPANNAS